MKLYQKETMKVVRFDVKEFDSSNTKKPKKAKGITVMETTVPKAMEHITKLFKNEEVTIKIKATQSPARCSITAYEALGSKRENYKSITLYGLTCDQIVDKITKSLS